MPGTVLHDIGQVVDHVPQMIAPGGITSRDSTFLSRPFHRVCLQGNSATAVAALCATLLAEGHSVVPLTAFSGTL